MFKWIAGVLIVIGIFWIGSMRSRWPKPSQGETCQIVPRSEDYMVEVSRSILTKIDLDTNKMAKEEMERELLSATGSAVNFAGKYVIVNHECGLGCQKHALVDVNTTKIIQYGLQTSKVFKFQPTSRIIIADSRYYEFKDNMLNYLCETGK